MSFQFIISFFISFSAVAQTQVPAPKPPPAGAQTAAPMVLPLPPIDPSATKPALPEAVREEAMAKVLKIYGTLSETGLTEGTKPAVSNFWYERPETFAVRYISPDPVKGITLFVEPKLARFIFPNSQGAIVLRNAPATQSLMKSTFLEAGRYFDYDAKPADTKTGGVTVKLNPKASGLPVKEGSWTLNKEFSYPVKYELVLNEGKYVREFTKIEFNGTKIPSKPRNFVPLEIEATDWDLNAKGATQANIDNELQLYYFVPGAMLGMQREKIIRQKGSQPAYGAIYRAADGHFLMALFQRKNRPTGMPADVGLPVTIMGKKALLLPGPLYSILSFSIGEVNYILLGNVSPTELLEASNEFNKAESPKPPETKK